MGKKNEMMRKKKDLRSVRLKVAFSSLWCLLASSTSFYGLDHLDRTRNPWTYKAFHTLRTWTETSEESIPKLSTSSWKDGWQWSVIEKHGGWRMDVKGEIRWLWVLWIESWLDLEVKPARVAQRIATPSLSLSLFLFVESKLEQPTQVVLLELCVWDLQATSPPIDQN